MENRDEKVFFGDVEDQKIIKEDEDEDEGKVEKFFELIRNLREARNRLVAETNSDNSQILVSENQKKNENKNINKRRKTTETKWVPSESYNNYSFEKEDFTADVEFRGTPSIFPHPCNTTSKRHVHLHKQELEDGLNLNLTL